MKNIRLLLSIICTLGVTISKADISEVTTSAAPSEYCIHETSVRGGFDRLIIDHNLIVPTEDQFKKGDVYVGARFKSKPNELWLLSGLEWRKINNNDDLVNAQYQGYDELPLVIPVTIFNDPVDISSAVGDGELWVGYGLRSASESSVVSFEEMVQSKRYDLVWIALPPPNAPVIGLRNPEAIFCLKTSEVKKTILASTVGPSKTSDDSRIVEVEKTISTTTAGLPSSP